MNSKRLWIMLKNNIEIKNISNPGLKIKPRRLLSSTHEMVIVPVRGKTEVKTASGLLFMLRRNILTEGSDALFLPISTDFVLNIYPLAEVAIVFGRTDKKSEIKVIKLSESTSVGKGNYSRSVRMICGSDGPTDRLIVGETMSPAGNWSSWPPHRHDNETVDESDHEEVYLFYTKSWGLMRIYDGNAQRFEAVYDGKKVRIEKGYHPVVASPFSDLYYLFALYGNHKNLKQKFSEI